MKQYISLSGGQDLAESIRHFHIIQVMGSQDIRQRYKRSRLGPFWITISMAVMITTMGLIFANLFKIPVREFLPYLTLGIIFWNFTQSSVSEGCDALIVSEGIIKQLPVPLNVHVLRVLYKNFIIFVHNIIIFPFVLLVVGKEINWHVLLFLPGLVLLVLNLAWIMMVISMICARYRDMTQIILSLMQVIFYVTPIIWMPKLLQNHIGQSLLNFNPLYHLLNIVRLPLLGESAPPVSYWVSGLMGVAGFIISIAVTTKYKYRIPYWV